MIVHLHFSHSVFSPIFAAPNGPVAQLNRVSDYGSEGSRFESLRGHSGKNDGFLTFRKAIFVLKLKSDYNFPITKR